MKLSQPQNSCSLWRIQMTKSGIINASRRYEIFGSPSLGKKGSYDFTTVSMSVGKRVFSKTAQRIFLKLLMKLGYPKSKNLTEQNFWEKSHFGNNPQKYPKNRFSGFCKKKISPLMRKFVGFKSCTIMIFVILLKPHVWEKSGSQVKCKNPLNQSDCRIFKL